jgi:hypothetical protein
LIYRDFAPANVSENTSSGVGDPPEAICDCLDDNDTFVVRASPAGVKSSSIAPKVAPLAPPSLRGSSRKMFDAGNGKVSLDVNRDTPRRDCGHSISRFDRT